MSDTPEKPPQKVEPARRYRLFPQGLSECLLPLVIPVFKQRGFGEYKILTEWEQIVGKQLAACTRPQKIAFPPKQKTGGTLHLHVLGANALEVQMSEPQILQQIASYLGYSAIARLQIIHAGNTLPLAGRGKK